VIFVVIFFPPVLIPLCPQIVPQVQSQILQNSAVLIVPPIVPQIQLPSQKSLPGPIRFFFRYEERIIPAWWHAGREVFSKRNLKKFLLRVPLC
jgi:hypothetical protein